MPIERNPKRPQTFRAGPNGKVAKTRYEVLQTIPGYSLIELHPETGRTHQLRVHLSHLGHPILGDTLYNGKPAERVFLHALSLAITIPSGEHMTFTAPEPASFKPFMKER
jgi:23S rRNA-/tRNA-specific pseudouridylate synthase